MCAFVNSLPYWQFNIHVRVPAAMLKNCNYMHTVEFQWFLGIAFNVCTVQVP